MRRSKGKRAEIEPLESRRMLAVQQFADLAPAGLNPYDLTPFNNKLIFGATSPQGQHQLWISDGTSGGTRMLGDVGPIDISFAVGKQMVWSGNYVYFFADEGDEPGLWRTDGTIGGTVFLKSFDTNDPPDWLTDFNGSLMFTTSGTLWRSDGTSDSTVIVRQFGNTYQSLLTSVGNWLYFFGGSDGKLWRSDGTAQGTSSYFNLQSPQTLTSNVAAIGDQLYVCENTDDAAIQGLWRTDPTLGMVRTGSFTSVTSLTDIDGEAWFVSSGDSVWWTDGTNLHNVYTSSDPLSNLVGVGNKVVLVARHSQFTGGFRYGDSISSAELLAIDKSGDGSSQELMALGSISDQHGIVESLTVDGRAVYVAVPTIMQGSEPVGVDAYLCQTDGSHNGTSQFAKSVVNWAGDAIPYQYNVSPTPIELDNKLVFGAKDAFGEFQLWSSDLTSSGTHVVFDQLGGNTNYSFSNLLTVGNTLYFATYNSNEIEDHVWFWKTDGVNPPQLIQAFDDVYHTNPTLFAAGQRLVAWMNDELWGTNNSGSLVKLVSNLTEVTPFAETSTRAYFTVNGNGLWATDGTIKGTVSLNRDIKNGTGYSDPTQFRGQLYFIRDRENSAGQVWSTNGTKTGTVQVTSLFSRLTNISATDIGVLASHFYLTLYDKNGGHLWVSNGTAPGTTLLANMAAHDFMPAKSIMYFSAADSLGRLTLYKSNGTKTGTVRVRTLAGTGTIESLGTSGQTLYFEINNPDEPPVPYVSDGTAKGTVNINSPADATISVTGGQFFATDSTGIYQWNQNQLSLLDQLPDGASTSVIVNLGNKYFFSLLTSDSEGLWYYTS